jgi:type I restriction enzyme S subunit
MADGIVFYKETEFKDTEIGRIPKEWEVVNLEGACVEITDGSHWSPKQVERSEYRIATVANLRETYIDIDSCKFISEEDYKCLVKEGDVPRKDDMLFSKDGTVGITFTFKQDSYKIGLLSSIAIIRPDHELLFSDFGAYALKSPNILMQITGWKTGTALRRIILDNLKRLKIMLPPLHEQRKIASILSTVDEAIQKTDDIIAKTERLKKGLMQELLTKGIGHTEFKVTEIGKIPKEWEVVKLENVVEIEDKYRIPVKKQDRQLGPFPYCGANGIIDYVAGYTHDGKFVLLAEDGGFFGPFENSAYIMRGKFWANNHVHILKAIEEVLISEFLAFCLNFINLVPFLTGSTRPKLTQEDMGMIPLPLPPLEEQQKIAEIISAVDEKLETLKQEKAKLERIKQWFMEELLSGRIRVRVA